MLHKIQTVKIIGDASGLGIYDAKTVADRLWDALGLANDEAIGRALTVYDLEPVIDAAIKHQEAMKALDTHDAVREKLRATEEAAYQTLSDRKAELLRKANGQ